MTDFVRVRVENGSHVSLDRDYAEAHNLKPLKQPAVGTDGRTLPAKHKTTVDKSAAASKEDPSSSDSAATNKEDSK